MIEIENKEKKLKQQIETIEKKIDIVKKQQEPEDIQVKCIYKQKLGDLRRRDKTPTNIKGSAKQEPIMKQEPIIHTT